MSETYATLEIEEDGSTTIRIPADLTRAWQEVAGRRLEAELNAACEPSGSTLQIGVWAPLLPEVSLSIDSMKL